MKEFINYAFYGNVIGHTVSTIETAYRVYCELFGMVPKDEPVNRICNEFNLYIKEGAISDGI